MLSEALVYLILTVPPPLLPEQSRKCPIMCQVKFIEGSRELLRGMCQLILGAEILKCNDFQPQTGSQSSQRDSKNSQNQFHYLVSDTLAISIPIPPPLSCNILPSPVLLYSLPSQCYYKLPRDIPKWLGQGKDQ